MIGSWIGHNRGLLLFMVLFGLFRTAVADWNPIPSGSMHPGLLEGDMVQMRGRHLILHGQPVRYRFGATLK
jgi:hypothetical protein